MTTMRTRRRIQLTLLLLGFATGVAGAQEFSSLGGFIAAQHAGSSYSWQLDYQKRQAQHLSWGVSYLNEGHLPERHRDGYAPMLWADADLIPQRLKLAAGVGPYLFFNTFRGTENRHGLKALASVAATWYAENNWFLQVRGNAVAGGEDVDTYSALAGVGYRFAGPGTDSAASSPSRETSRNEISLLVGQAILNSTGSRDWSAAALEFRRRLHPHLDATLAALVEGDSSRVRRYGAMTQLWGTQDLIPDKLRIGIGVGPYLRIASHHTPPSNSRASAVITLTGSYTLHRSWVLRTSWNRFYTTDDHDADVIVGGIGYLF